MRKSGFTLIELLIVLAIIAILATALVPMFRTARWQTQQAKARAEMEAIKKAAHLLYLDTGEWPPSGTNGNGLINSNDIVNVADWNGPYLDEWKRDPWNRNYWIIGSPVAGLVVVTWGANGFVGGDDPADEDLYLVIMPGSSP